MPFRRSADVVLGALEVGQDIPVAPPRRALRLPGVVVPRAAADVEHGVHRAGAAEPLPARDVEGAPVDMRLGLGGVVPVELGVELLGERGRDLDVRRAVLGPGLEQQDADRRVGPQPIGEARSPPTRHRR